MAQTLSEDQVRRILSASLLDLVMAAVEDGALSLRDYLTKHHKKFNRTLAAANMRHWVRTALEEAKDVQYTEDENGFQILYPANIGIRFDFEGVNFRAYTVPAGKAPRPSSEELIRFLENKPREQGVLGEKAWLGNIVLLWTFDKNGFISGFRAVHPGGFDGEQQLTCLFDIDLLQLADQLQSTAERHFQPASEEDDSLVTKEQEQLGTEAQTPAEDKE